HRFGGVAAQVLIGEKQHSAGALKGPIQNRAGIGRGADNTAVAAAKGLQAGGGVDVGDGGDVGSIDHFPQFFPAAFDLIDGGHSGHGAAGSHVGQHDRNALAAALGKFFGPVGDNVGRFGHEVDTAKGNVAAVAAVGGHATELVAVALQIGQGDHFVLLVVM